MDAYTTQALERLRDLHAQRAPMPPLVAKLATPAVLILGIVSTLPPPGPTRVMFGLTAFTMLWGYALTHWEAGAYFFLDAILIISITFRWALMVLFGTPEEDYRQIHDTATKITGSGPLHKRIFHKLKWSVELWACWRGIGWNFEDRHQRKGPEQSQTRLKFLITNLCWIGANTLISQLILSHVFCRFWPEAVSGKPDLWSFPQLNRHVLVLCQLIRDWLMLDTEYRKVALICVALQLSSTSRWPPLFGNPADLYNVRNFWGRVWHQTFRNIFTKFSDIAADMLGARKGTLVYKYTKLYVGFMVSGIQHYAPPLFIPSEKHGWGMFWQMPIYAALITVEDFIKYCGKRAGIRDNAIVRLVGYTWTAYWMTLLYGLPVAYVADIGGFTGVCR
ncbi:membrane bound O-acyl transferase family-domain-containing protein [Macrophomina phaseolina]|uniref:Membrane bound O-acyl transferase family-domain-containing protein n=1 Tax=Macrophomina phaseolina TaxID=35725 RepID=A0ABQ8G2M5_9PEZI|nr:membrane bound O-acyl transferase family-domain-containing protein [Macrophomina phaseolina]